MTTLGPITIDIRGAVANHTIRARVIGMRRFKVRTWIGTRLLCLAAWVIGCKVDVNIEE